MGQGVDMYGSDGKLVKGSASLKNPELVEETPEAKKRRVEKAWNDRYFASLGMSGLGGAAKIEAHKVANPQWTKNRDAWAQAQVKPKPKPPAGSTLGTLAGVKP